MEQLKYHFKFFLLAVGVVLVWRGIWGLADIYLFPDQKDIISLLASVALGMVVLIFTDRKLNELL